MGPEYWYRYLKTAYILCGREDALAAMLRMVEQIPGDPNELPPFDLSDPRFVSDRFYGRYITRV